MPLKNPRFSSCSSLRAAAENAPPLKAGATGEGVAILQQALIDLGFPMPVSTAGGSKFPDGIYGNETTAKVKAFQTANGLQADGQTGRRTLEKLEELIAARHEADKAAFRADVRYTKSYG